MSRDLFYTASELEGVDEVRKKWTEDSRTQEQIIARLRKQVASLKRKVNMPPPETRPETWRRVNPGDNLIFQDKMSIEARMAEGKGPTPETYQVAFRLTIKNKLAEWILYCINEEQGIFLLAKLVDKAVALAVYTENPSWTPSVRAEILGTDRDFIFTPPPDDQIDPDKGFIGDPNTLRYADDIEHGEGEDQIVYVKKGQGEQSGTVAFNPLQSGVVNHVATVVEYSADQEKTPESELMFVESGEAQHGVIKMLLGRPLKISDIKVMR